MRPFIGGYNFVFSFVAWVWAEGIAPKSDIPLSNLVFDVQLFKHWVMLIMFIISNMEYLFLDRLNSDSKNSRDTLINHVAKILCTVLTGLQILDPRRFLFKKYIKDRYQPTPNPGSLPSLKQKFPAFPGCSDHRWHLRSRTGVPVV